jgi:hypothetical protein
MNSITYSYYGKNIKIDKPYYSNNNPYFPSNYHVPKTSSYSCSSNISYGNSNNNSYDIYVSNNYNDKIVSYNYFNN